MIETVGGTGVGVGVGGLVLGSIQKISQQQQQQFFLIQPNMISSNGTTTLVALTNQVLKPGMVQILQKPEESNKPVSLKRPLHSPLSYDILSSDDDSKCGFLETEEERKVRKRANLDHLSHEEKMMRRKLKNRVAAQNARDKKKVKMEEMEVTIKMLEQKNRALQKQNQQLAEQNSHLAAENNNLRNETNSGISLNEVVKEEIPFSPASLPPSSQHSLSDLEDDGFEFRPIVESRCGGPAVPTSRLQQKDRNRDPANDRSRILYQLVYLLWTLLIGPFNVTSKMTLNITDQTKHQKIVESKLEAVTTPAENKLPPKKRNHWWGSHRQSPHPKT